MKTKILTLLLSLTLTLSFSQTDFKWEKIDSLNKSKTQIYSDTKMYIAQNLGVIQSDDKDGGVIVFKGEQKELIKYGISPYTYYYSYIITFLMKDNKVKIILNNVNCNKTEVCKTCTYRIPCIPPFEGENYPDVHETLGDAIHNTGIGGNMSNLSKKKQKELMVNLKADLQNIVDNYIITIKKQSINSNW